MQVALSLVRQVRCMFFQEDTRESMNRPQRGTQVMRNAVAEGLKLFIGGLELGRALNHSLFQLVARNRGRLEFLGHPVEGARQLANLVLGGDAELEIEIACAYDRGAFAQLREWPGHAS